LITPCGIPLHGVWSVEGAWYDAHSQAMGGSMMVAKGELIGTCGNGAGKLAVGDAVCMTAADVD
jgi:hypothetical protein